MTSHKPASVSTEFRTAGKVALKLALNNSNIYVLTKPTHKNEKKIIYIYRYIYIHIYIYIYRYMCVCVYMCVYRLND